MAIEVCVIGEFSKFTGSNSLAFRALYQTQVFPLCLPSILKKSGKEKVPQKEFKQLGKYVYIYICIERNNDLTSSLSRERILENSWPAKAFLAEQRYEIR